MIFNPFKSPLIKGIFVVVIATSLFSCSSNKTEENSEAQDTTSVEENAAGQKMQNVFYSMPSPIELAQLIKKAGATYNKDILNPADNASKYTSSLSKALNLGVYGADLAYTTIFDQTQESIKCLGAAKKLADGLGISGAFNEQTMKRMQANSGNSDSLLEIITDSYFTSNATLKENEQSNAADLALTGGWIEGLYIGTQVAKTTKNNMAMITRIAELKGSLNNLIAILETHGNDADLTKILNDLKELKVIYDEMPTDTSKPTVTSDSKTNVITIGGASTYTLTTEQLNKISKKAEALRAGIIKV